MFRNREQYRSDFETASSLMRCCEKYQYQRSDENERKSLQTPRRSASGAEKNT